VSNDFSLKVFNRTRLKHGEAPVWDEDKQVVWVADAWDCAIHAIALDGSIVASRSLPQNCGSMFFSRKAMYLALADGVYRVDKDGLSAVTRERISDTGALNDGKAGPDGRFYVGQCDMELGSGRFFRMDPDGSLTVLLDGQKISNGLAWSPDEKTLYHTDTRKCRIDAYAFDAASGTLGGRRTVIEFSREKGAADGFTIDEEGNLWVAMMRGGQVLHIDPLKGEVLDVIDMPASKVTSCAFIGPHLDYLVITTGSSVDLQQEPLAGFTFVCRPGVRGKEAYFFRDEG
jgi:sugar lactone lactonase YvrE